MTSSSYLALLFGVYVLAVAIPMIFNPKRLVDMMHQLLDSPPLIFLTAIAALIAGISVISFHNIWTPDWRGLITFLGWAAAIEGVLLIIAPGMLIKVSRKFLSWPKLIPVLGAFYLALGAYFVSRAFV